MPEDKEEEAADAEGDFTEERFGILALREVLSVRIEG